MKNYDILHVADLHLGASKHIMGEAYLLRAKKMLWEIIRLVKDYKIKHVVLAGDIFDVADPDIEVMNLFLKFVVTLDSLCILMIDEGNHDSQAADKSALDYIRILCEGKNKKLKNTHVAIYTTKLVELPEATYCMIPWNLDIVKETKIAYDTLKKKPKRFIVVGHLPLPGITTDTGWFIKGSTNMLQHKFVDTYLLGDIHARFISKCGRLQMPGSPIQHIWSDLPNKGVSLIKYSDLSRPVLERLEVEEFALARTLKEAKKHSKSGKIIKLVSNEVVDELPAGVVAHENFFSQDELITYETEFKITEGLPEYLSEKGFSKKEQKLSMHIMEKLLQKEKSVK